MKSTDPITATMDEKRKALLDNCTRALCGDTTLDNKLMDEATGGRYSKQNGESVDQEQIKTLILALRWLGLPVKTEPKTRKRRTTQKASAGNGSPVVKRRGRPRGSKNKKAKEQHQLETETQTTTPSQVETPVETPIKKPQIETPMSTQPQIPITPPSDLKDVTFEGGGLPQ